MSQALTPSMESAQLDCPECHTPITYYDVKGSEYYACPKCHTYFRYSGEETPKVLGRYDNVAPPETQLLPMGTLGVLEGQPCRVVGMMERGELTRNGKLQYHWLEYQIYQPNTNDYAQLMVFDGHWMVIRPAKRSYRVDNAKSRRASITLPDATYRLYNRYQSRVVFAVGEFDWDIKSDDKLRFAEFISPPVMLVKESKDRDTWYRAEHMEPYAVAKAFGLKESSLPSREGVGAVQPDPVAARLPAMRLLTGLAVALLLLGQVLFSLQHPREALLTETLKVEADATAAAGTGRVIVSPSFTLKEQAALLIELNTTLSNQWLELPVSLVNEQTGQGFEFTKNIEFYSGVESGESWSEGSRDTDAVLSQVPAGRYHLNFYPLTEAGPAAPDITVRVVANPVIWSNFFIVLLLLLVYPAWLYFRRASHETARWNQSDYGPTE
ncbi:DUF4178 domain-containing protein [Hymenobacter sp. IS2118]|uniref:DUF4178 domain-containing protein n=1 Tax=Hymenobacter sp. IS2118 TaxID=1505605 RepID=UPI000558F54E|nr:DUF4178 domain-containing protein [Hymenobacter sp. IS2118]